MAGDHVKTVAVMMSTYNGEKYIKEQIDSIRVQEGVSVHLYIRDDGSTDGTVRYLNSIGAEPDITITYGKNIGWRKSFFSLLYNVPDDYDFYAWADQDDIWLKEKLLRAVTSLDRYDTPSLYCSEQIFVDDTLQEIRRDVHKIPRNYREGMTNIASRGCCEVFNQKLCRILQSFHIEDGRFSHDRWVARAALFTGDIFFDRRSFIWYRQHEGNASGTSYNITLKDRAQRLLSTYRSHDFYYWYAKELLDHYAGYVDAHRKKWLRILVASKYSLKCKAILLFSRDFKSETLLGTLVLKCIMLLGLYQ